MKIQESIQNELDRLLSLPRFSTLSHIVFSIGAVVQQGPFTYACLYDSAGNPYNGFAKCNATDTCIPSIGRSIALSRCLQLAAERYSVTLKQRRANAEAYDRKLAANKRLQYERAEALKSAKAKHLKERLIKHVKGEAPAEEDSTFTLDEQNALGDLMRIVKLFDN